MTTAEQKEELQSKTVEFKFTDRRKKLLVGELIIAFSVTKSTNAFSVHVCARV